MGLWEWVAYFDRIKFGNKAKLWFKSKLLISTPQKQISTATKITCSYPFRMRLAPVSLLYNLPFPKTISLASALQHPFRTGSKHPKKRVAPHTGLGRMLEISRKNIIDRVLNRSPGVERAAALRLLLVLFVEAKRINPFPFRGVSRFCKPRFSAHRQQFCASQIKSLAATRHFPGGFATLWLLCPKNRPAKAPLSCNQPKCAEKHDGIVKIRRSRLTNPVFCAKIMPIDKINALYGESSPEKRFTESRRLLQDGIVSER